jgi:hypothetical protein
MLNMKKTISYITTALILFMTSSCDTNETPALIDGELENSANAQIEFNEENLLKAALSQINASPSEVGQSQIKKLHLNEDEFEDAYISINLSKRAYKDLEKVKNPSMLIDAGYLGNYNYLIIWDGATKQLSTTFPISSNGLESLSIEHTNLFDPGYKTLSATYRVRNSAFETFFRYVNGTLLPLFSYKKMDHIGTEKPEAYTYELVENPALIQQDIYIYEATITNYSQEKANQDRNYYPITNFTPINKPIQHYFFEKSLGKYASTSN